MGTMLDLVADTRRMVYGSMSEQINLLDGAVSAGGTTLTMELDVSTITVGSVLSSGLNVWFVRSVDQGTKQVEVIPGYDNAPQPACLDGAVVTIRPRATDWAIFSTLCDVIRSLSSPAKGLYRVGTWTADVDPTYQTYAIPTLAQDATGLLGARILVPGSDDQWVDIPAKAMKWQDSSNLIRITRDLPSGQTIQFRYKGPFVVPTDLTTDPIATVGLTDSMIDIPPLGAAVQLLRTTDARRGQVQTQGDARRASEVGSGSNLTTAREFDRDFRDRVGDEALRLAAQNSYRQDI